MDFSESEEINVVMTEQEEAEIASFYSIDPESIVRGKSFDFKYAYLYQPDLYGYDSVIAPDAMSIEVVMKHNKTLKVGEVAFFYDNYKLIEYDYRDQDEQIVTVQENPGHLFSPLQPGADVNYQRLGQARNLLFYIYMMMNFEIEYGTGPFDISNLTFTIELKDSRSPFYRTESYDLIYNEERRLSETRKVKELCMSGTACNRYEKKQVGYYFGILFHKNFDQWYKEIKEFISKTEEYNEYNLMITFTNPCTRIKDKSLQEKLDVNEEQLQECLEIMDILQYQCEFYP